MKQGFLTRTFIIINVLMLAGCASASRRDLAIELFKSGLMYADNGEYERALREYDRAIKTDLNCAAAYNGKGNVFFMQEKYDLAVTEYKKAIRSDPGYAKAYNNLGFAYLQENRYDLAIEEFGKAIIRNDVLPFSFNVRRHHQLMQVK